MNDRADGTSSLIASMYSHVPENGYHLNLLGPVSEWKTEWRTDEAAVTEKSKILGMILERGARWRPADKDEVKPMRKAMKRMSAGSTLDFVKLMVKHKACERAAMEELFRSESLRAHCWKHVGEIYDLLERLPEKMRS